MDASQVDGSLVDGSLVDGAAQRRREVVDQLAGSITSATRPPDRVVRITFLTAALEDLRRDLVDNHADEPEQLAAALLGLDTDRSAAASCSTSSPMLPARPAGTVRTRSGRPRRREDRAWEQLRHTRATDRSTPEAAAAQLTYLRERADRLRLQIDLYPASPQPDGSPSWGRSYRSSLPEQLDTALAQIAELERGTDAAPTRAAAADDCRRRRCPPAPTRQTRASQTPQTRRNPAPALHTRVTTAPVATAPFRRRPPRGTPCGTPRR